MSTINGVSFTKNTHEVKNRKIKIKPEKLKKLKTEFKIINIRCIIIFFKLELKYK